MMRGVGASWTGSGARMTDCATCSTDCATCSTRWTAASCQRHSWRIRCSDCNTRGWPHRDELRIRHRSSSCPQRTPSHVPRVGPAAAAVRVAGGGPGVASHRWSAPCQPSRASITHAQTLAIACNRYRSIRMIDWSGSGRVDGFAFGNESPGSQPGEDQMPIL